MRSLRLSTTSAVWRSVAYILFLLLALPALGQEQRPNTQNATLSDIQAYIANAWETLTRSPNDCKTVIDGRNPKNSILYFPADVQPTPQARELESRCGIHIRQLPRVAHAAGDLAKEHFEQQGLLYLPNAYVVPGGFFNEMYGWDSYFIILGLLRDNRVALARGMVDNFLYEIEHYGAILNANRTYFLSRSQPPFLTSMIMAVHQSQAAAKQDDREWLARAYALAVRDHDMWTKAPHLAGNTGLSRYYDLGEGPGPEITDTKDSYYDDVARHMAERPETMTPALSAAAVKDTPADWPRYSHYLCPAGTQAAEKCSPATTLAFTADYYKGDRSDRESGFDITFRFGPFAGQTHHFAAVCLNSLLYKTEQDLAQLSVAAGHPDDAPRWKQRAAARKAAIDKYLWNAKAGMYFDFDTVRNAQSTYVYASTFYPLWAGLASPEQARAVASHLKLMERPGGLATSTTESGVQWDMPYGWAPLQLIAAEGLRRNGVAEDANRLSTEFLATVLRNFRRDGTIREKYNVVTGSSEAKVTAGYQANVIGFGWTNGVFLELLNRMPASARASVETTAAKSE
jgi:alpha,alpha-trehalase